MAGKQQQQWAKRSSAYRYCQSCNDWRYEYKITSEKCKCGGLWSKPHQHKRGGGKGWDAAAGSSQEVEGSKMDAAAEMMKKVDSIIEHLAKGDTEGALREAKSTKQEKKEVDKKKTVAQISEAKEKMDRMIEAMGDQIIAQQNKLAKSEEAMIKYLAERDEIDKEYKAAIREDLDMKSKEELANEGDEWVKDLPEEDKEKFAKAMEAKLAADAAVEAIKKANAGKVAEKVEETERAAPAPVETTRKGGKGRGTAKTADEDQSSQEQEQCKIRKEEIKNRLHKKMLEDKVAAEQQKGSEAAVADDAMLCG